eukprot:TRINITY_DN3640_c0_g1_i1.p1 TRINITY_DN3640_c0_g1~~TRINITY_DN3640_c0_g1_i1.p1  ORF type:complete len:116 (+),score=45.15 TRINITY_DN3640_c0_g1_i1:33-350(+)
MHVVSDVFLRRCSTNVGWYYHEASKLEQQYKISHYVLECSLICTFSQYMMCNYYAPNALLPSLDFNAHRHKPKIAEEDDDEEDDSDDDDDEDDEDDEMMTDRRRR